MIPFATGSITGRGARGEGCAIDWDGRWLGVTPRQNLPVKSFRRLDKASNRLGFRTLFDGLRVRSNNFAMAVQEINELLEAMAGYNDLV